MTRSLLQLPLHDDSARSGWFRLARQIALVAAVYSTVVLGFILVSFVRDRQGNPLVAADVRAAVTDQPGNSSRLDPLIARFKQLQARLIAAPDDETLKQEIRQVDLQLRQRFFAHRARISRGAYLLLGGLVIMLAALKASTQLGPTLPGAIISLSPREDARRVSAMARRALVGAGGALIAVLALLAVAPVSPIQIVGAAPSTHASTTVVLPLPSREQWTRNWPCFRGPQGSGLAKDATPPTKWDGTTKQGILWQSPLPLDGNNSPIVWEGRVYLSGAMANQQEVLCFDAVDGKLLWRHTVTGPVAGSSLVLNPATGFSACTMATDGRAVFACFATGDLAAFDLDGHALWNKNLGKPDSAYGHAASLAVWKDRVIVQFDQGSDALEGKSALLAFDSLTGKQLWKTPRPVPNSWASPIVIDPPSGPQILTCAKPWVIAYNPDDGRELWKASVLEGDVAASPAWAGASTIFVANDQAKLSAIAIDGHGDVTAAGVKWSADEGMPDISSPLATEELVLLVQSNGGVTCYDARTGKQNWQHDFAVNFQASPVLVGKTIYLIDTAGSMHLIDASARFNEIGTANLGEEVHASPAFVGNRIYIRGVHNLYCIGSK